jgi:hypothetical protein
LRRSSSVGVSGAFAMAALIRGPSLEINKALKSTKP